MSRPGLSVLIRSSLLLAVALLSGVLISASAGGAVAASGSASAVAVSLAIPGSTPIEGGASASSGTSDTTGTFRYPDDGSLIAVPSFASSASGGAGKSVSQAVVDIPEASLFGGEVVVTGVTARAQARVQGEAVSADAAGSAVAGVTIAGQPLTLASGQTAPVADWGLITVGASETVGDVAQRQIVVRSLRLTLTAEHKGFPAGTEISLGIAIAELQIEEPAATTTTTTTTTLPPEPKTKPVKKRPRPQGEAGKPKPEKLPVFSGPPDIDVSPQLTKQGYVFPIFGQAWYASTLGAARANTGWHHGTDIFASFGAPVLAVADGTLFSVGWNKVGGYRLWLRDRQGNQFYYAHLAAYSQLAREGREVRAGQVIGFNGNTGDAQGTPFHVHFEVHPVGLLPLGYDGVVDPYPYLLAWRRLLDVSLAVGTGWAPPVEPTATAPEPAAILLQSYDISTASGLEPGALERAAAGQSPSGTDIFFDPSAPCAECERSQP